MNVIFRYVCGIVKNCLKKGYVLVIMMVVIDIYFVSVLSGRISVKVMSDSIVVIVSVFYGVIRFVVIGCFLVCLMCLLKL